MRNLFFLLLFPTLLWAEPDSLSVILNQNYRDSGFVDKLNDYGRDLLRLQPLQSLKFSQKAYQLSIETGYKAGEARAANNLGNLMGSQGKYEKAILYYQRALHLRDSLNDRKGVASTLNNISIIYQSQTLYADALSYSKKSLKERESIRDTIGIAMTHQSLGAIYTGLQNSDSALYHMYKALQFARSVRNDWVISDCLSNIGDIYGNKGRLDSAAFYLQKSMDMKAAIGDLMNLPNCMYAYIKNVLIPNRQWDKGIETGLKALKIAEENHARESEFQTRFLLADIYARKGDFRNAYYFVIEAQASRDSVWNRSVLEKITRLEMQSQFDRQIQEQLLKDEARERESRLQRIALFTSLAALLGAALLALSFFRQSKTRKKRNEELKSLNNSILNQNQLIRDQQEEMTIQHKTIQDSIRYASRIQRATLPGESVINTFFPEGKIWYQPRDVVSGDFYWVQRVGDYTFLAVGDGTGHGVPGAFMSLIGINLLNEVIVKDQLLDPGKILQTMDELVRRTLHLSDGIEVHDGMDLALIRFGPQEEVLFCGAARPIWLISEAGIREFKSSRYSLGGWWQEEKGFETIVLPAKRGNVLLAFTDGITDQMGGPLKRKITSRGLARLLENQPVDSPESTLKKIQKYFLTWKGDHRQMDDIVVACVKI
jgi:serine phosphatase RsbU (regulator of sigma subunit)